MLDECEVWSVRRAQKNQYSKSLTEKSLSRVEEAQRNGTLILLERVLQYECGARIGARLSPYWTVNSDPSFAHEHPR
jgi:hypothetical protein